jgi:hypothetical protein
MRRSLIWFTSVLMFATALTIVEASSVAQLARIAPRTTVIPVNCEVGGVGTGTRDHERDFFGIVVVEVASPVVQTGVSVTAFQLVDENGVVQATLKGVREIREFIRVRRGSEGVSAYYTRKDGNPLWNGTLPAGTSRLQVDVAFMRRPRVAIHGLRWRMELGGLVVDGPVCGEWPT